MAHRLLKRDLVWIWWQVGVVATHANVLRVADIPTLYHCTFAKPIVLIPEAIPAPAPRRLSSRVVLSG